jgi:N,N-dimethylformamidase beta subunit-like protein
MRRHAVETRTRFPSPGGGPPQSGLVFSARIAAVAALAVLGAAVSAAGASPAADRRSPGRVPSGAVMQQAPQPVNVRAENRAPGTPGWRIPAVRGAAPGLSAYAGAVSVRPGQSVPLVVSATGAVSVRAFRIGWYGGAGARQVWRGTVRAHQQPGPPTTWAATGSADTTGWPEGHYLLRLDQGAASRFMPLTLRSASAAGRVLVLTSPLSWRATDVTTPSAGGTGPAAALSFDRPYTRGAGGGGFLVDDAGVVQNAERTGRRLAYATDYDLATDPSLATGAAAIVTGSDSRFWTTAGRRALSTAAADGTNLAFFGAGTASRSVQLSGRVLTVRKGVSSSVRLTGLRPSCVGVPAAPAVTAWTVGDAQWWGYRGAEVENHRSLTGLVGLRADHAAFSADGSPDAVQVLSYGSITCGGAYSVQSAAYFTKASGAGVFTAGTARWNCALTGTCVKSAATRRFTATVTQNVVKAFATAKAGKRRPVVDSSAEYPSLR